jgi:hypothetical protein
MGTICFRTRKTVVIFPVFVHVCFIIQITNQRSGQQRRTASTGDRQLVLSFGSLRHIAVLCKAVCDLLMYQTDIPSTPRTITSFVAYYTDFFGWKSVEISRYPLPSEFRIIYLPNESESRQPAESLQRVISIYMMIMSMGWDYVSELGPPTDLLFVPQMMYEHGQTWWIMSTENSWLVHQSSLAILPAEPSGSKQDKRAKIMINLALPNICVHICEWFLYAVKSYDMGPRVLFPSEGTFRL